MPDSFTVSAVLPASADTIRDAWLSTEGHTAMTGAPATVEGAVGGRFTAWDGYIEGTTTEIGPDRIVQRWRSAEFPADAPDSRIEVTLEPVEGGTRVTIVHTEIPEGQGRAYQEGWHAYYFTPMTTWAAR